MMHFGEKTVLVLVAIIFAGITAGVFWHFSEVSGRQQIIIGKLEKLEGMRAPATARRFTADDALVLLACDKLPPEQRDLCRNELNKKLEKRQ